MDSHNRFLGRGWSFPPEFDADGRSVRMSDTELDIDESLRILFSTCKGERIMHPKFGCDLHAMVFSEMNLTAMTQIKTAVEEAILFFEPRINVEEVQVYPASQVEGQLLIEVDYTIIATNNRANMVYPFYLNEGTLVNTSLLPGGLE